MSFPAKLPARSRTRLRIETLESREVMSGTNPFVGPLEAPSPKPAETAGIAKTHTAVLDQGDFYWANGSPMKLSRRTDQIAVTADAAVLANLTAPGAALDGFKESKVLLGGTRILTNPDLATAAAEDGRRLQYATLTNALTKAAKTPGVQRAVPVFQNGETGTWMVVTNEVIVSLKPGEDPAKVFGADTRYTGYRPLIGTSDQFVATTATVGAGTLNEANRLESEDPRVTWATPNFFQDFRKFATTNDPLLSQQWHLNNTGQLSGLPDADVDGFEAWDITTGDPNIVVSVVDDGMQFAHPDLINNIYVNTGEIAANGVDDDGNGYIDDRNGWDFTSAGVGDNDPGPSNIDDAHSTSVAGVIAASGNNNLGVAGIAYQSRLIPVRVFDGAAPTSDAGFASAIYYAAGRTADGLGTFRSGDIMNNSWGGGSPTTAITNAFAWATANGRSGKGTVSFIATGNDSLASVSFPATLSASNAGVIAVGASSDGDVRSGYSNYGPEVTFVAPSNGGVFGIVTTDRTGADGYNPAVGVSGDYTSTAATAFGGTSSATPLAAGIGALTLARDNTLTAAQVRAYLRNTTDLIGGAAYDSVTGFNPQYGTGRINANTAVRNVGVAEIQVLNGAANVADNSGVVTLNAAVGTSASLALRIRNQGTSPLNLSSLAIGGSGPFSIVNGFGDSSLAVGESTTFTVQVSPVTAVPVDQTLSFTTNDADESAYNFTLRYSPTRVFEDFDSVTAPALPNGWTRLLGGVAPASWVTNSTNSFSAPNHAFVPDLDNTGDNRLVSPTFQYPVNAQISFRHQYIMETGYDGGVLEISVNGGAFTDILSAGGSFVSGGYNGFVSGSTNNPLPPTTSSSRAAWTGDSLGYIQTIVNLPPGSANQNVALQWRQGTDGSVSGTGWRIDQIESTFAPPWANIAPVLTDAVVAMNDVAQVSVAPSGPVGTLVSSLVDFDDGSGLDNVTDADAGATTGIAIVASNVTNGSWFYSVNNGGIWTPLGTPSLSSARLLMADSNTRLYFRPVTGFAGTVNAGLTFHAWDSSPLSNGGIANLSVIGIGGSTAYSLASDTVSVKVNNVAPVLADVPVALTPITQDSPVPVGAVGTRVLALVDLTGGGGLDNVTDPDSAAVTGIAITASDEINGDWYYSTNNGTNWNLLGTPSPGMARLLAADFGTRLYFQPLAGTFGPLSSALTFRAWDRTSGTNGGTANVTVNGGETPFSAQTDTADINVLEPNTAPALDDVVVALNDIPQNSPLPVGPVGTRVSSLVDLDDGAGLDNVFDDDTGAVAGIAIIASAETNGDWFFSTDDGNSWTSLGTPGASAARLLAADSLTRLYFHPAAGFVGTIPAGLTFRAWDQTAGGNGDTANITATGLTTPYSTATDTASIRVTNAAPTLADASVLLNNVAQDSPAPVGQVGTLVSALVDLDDGAGLDNVTDSDIGATTGIAVVASAEANGDWYYSLNNGLNWTSLVIPADEALLLAADVGTRVYFKPNAGFFGPVTAGLTFHAWDRTSGVNGGTADVTVNGGETAFSADVDTADLTVLKAAEAPVLTDANVTLDDIPINRPAPSGAVGTLVSALVDFNGGAGLNNVTDGDPDALLGIAVVASAETNGDWWYSIDDGDNWVLLNPPSATSARLLAADSGTRVYFQPATGFVGTVTAGLTFRAWDQLSGTNGGTANVTVNGGTTAFSAATDTASIRVVNAAPVLGDKEVALDSIGQNSPAPSGGVGTLVSALVDLDGGAGLNNVTDSDIGAVTGMAVTDSDEGNGNWHFSTDNGMTWSPLGPLPDNSARLLAADAGTRVYFQPANGFLGTIPAGLTFRAWDRTSGTNGSVVNVAVNGGETPYSAETDSASITVSNNAPVLDNSGSPYLIPVARNTTSPEPTPVGRFATAGITDPNSGTTLGAIAVIGVDSANGQWGYSIDNGETWDTLAEAALDAAVLLLPTDLVVFTPNTGYVGSASITYHAWDLNSGTHGETADLSVATGGSSPFSVASETAALRVATVFVETPEDGKNTGSLVSSFQGATVQDAQGEKAKKGVAIIGSGGTMPGRWEYSTGGAFKPFGALDEAHAIPLRSADKVRFVGETDQIGEAWLQYRAWDQAEGIQGVPINLAGASQVGGATAFSARHDFVFARVIAVNDKPVLDAMSKAVLAPVAKTDTDPDGKLVSAILASTATDPDPGTIPGLAVTAAPKTGGKWQFLPDTETEWQDVPTVSPAKALLLGPADQLRFLPNGTFTGKSTLSYKAWDQTAGEPGLPVDATVAGSISTATGSLTVEVTKEAPAFPAANVAPELDDSTDITLADINEDGKPRGVLVSGLLGDTATDANPGTLIGIALTGMTGRTTGNWQYSSNGTTWKNVGVASPDSALLLKHTDQIRYLPNLNFNGSVELSYHAWDQSRGTAGQRANLRLPGTTDGASAFSAEDESVAVTVLPGNDAPILDNKPDPWLTSVVPGGTIVPAGDLVSSLLGTALTDVDAAAERGIAITGAPATQTTGRWEFLLQAPLPPGVVPVWTRIGGVSPGNALFLRDTDKIRFLPSANFIGTAKLTYVGWDRSEGFTPGTSQPTAKLTSISKASETATVFINAVNDKPVLDTKPDTRLPAVAVNSSNTAGTLVSAVLGSLVRDPDVGALSGLAITAADTKNGVWEYSLNGVNWNILPAVTPAKAVVLRSTDRVRFTPFPAFAGLTTFKFKAWDQSGGGAPGSTMATTSSAFSTAVETVTLSVNTSPVLNLG